MANPIAEKNLATKGKKGMYVDLPDKILGRSIASPNIESLGLII